jgi:hypothetical protein
MPEYPIIHVETIELRGLEEISNGTLGGLVEILGTRMRVIFLRVKDSGAGVQIADGDPSTQQMYNYLCGVGGHHGFCTTQLEGHDGEWVMMTTPDQR